MYETLAGFSLLVSGTFFMTIDENYYCMKNLSISDRGINAACFN